MQSVSKHRFTARASTQRVATKRSSIRGRRRAAYPCHLLRACGTTAQHVDRARRISGVDQRPDLNDEVGGGRGGLWSGRVAPRWQMAGPTPTKGRGPSLSLASLFFCSALPPRKQGAGRQAKRDGERAQATLHGPGLHEASCQQAQEHPWAAPCRLSLPLLAGLWHDGTACG